jgi:hypothetical protein
METSYTFSETPSGATIVELHNRGRPSVLIRLMLVVLIPVDGFQSSG